MNKNFWIGIGVAAVIIACFFLIRQCNGGHPDVIAAVDSVQYYRNQNGQLITAIKQREQDYYKEKQGFLDSIAKLHNSKSKLITEVVSLQQKATARITTAKAPDIIYKDTGTTHNVIMPGPVIDGVTQEFNNPWYNATVIIPLNGDSSVMNLQVFDSLRIVSKIVKEGSIFNRHKYLQIDAINSNPYDSIHGLQVYRKPLTSPKKIGIGIQFGYGFSNSLKPTPYVGVGISYNFIRL